MLSDKYAGSNLSEMLSPDGALLPPFVTMEETWVPFFNPGTEKTVSRWEYTDSSRLLKTQRIFRAMFCKQ